MTRREALTTMTLAVTGAIFFGADSTSASTPEDQLTHLCLIGDSRTVHMLRWLKTKPDERKKLGSVHAVDGTGLGDWFTNNGVNRHIGPGIAIQPRKNVRNGLSTCIKWLRNADERANEKHRYVFAVMLGVNDCKSPKDEAGAYDLTNVPDVKELSDKYVRALRYLADRYHNVEFVFIANPPVNRSCKKVAPETVDRFNHLMKAKLPRKIRYSNPHAQVRVGQRHSLRKLVMSNDWTKVMKPDGLHYITKGNKLIWLNIKAACRIL